MVSDLKNVYKKKNDNCYFWNCVVIMHKETILTIGNGQWNKIKLIKFCKLKKKYVTHNEFQAVDEGFSTEIINVHNIPNKNLRILSQNIHSPAWNSISIYQ